MIARVARIAGQVVLLLAVLYAVLVGLGLLLTKVVDDTELVDAEDAVNRGLASIRTPEMDDVTYLLSGVGATVAIVGAMLVVAVCLRLAMHRWHEPVFLAVAVTSQALVFLLVTLVISRQRPDVPQLDDSPPTSSFPSGHTGAATALFVASALLVAWYVRRRAVRLLAVAVLLAVPLLVAYGRLYRGMHHPTDVLAAFLNGAVCVGIASAIVLGRLPWSRRRVAREAPSSNSDDGSHTSRAAIVYNPTKIPNFAGHQRRVLRFMATAGWDPPLWLETTRDDPGIGMVERAIEEKCDLVFVCGGDGTVMAAVTALAGSEMPLAILPLGTGNLLARNLGIPIADEAAALRVGVHGRDRRIDVCAVDGRRFAVMAGIGFDAAMMRDAPERLKKRMGGAAYVLSGARHLRGRAIRVKLTLDDGEPLHRRVRTVVVGNVGRLQYGIPLLPEAEADDGILDVVLVAPRHALDWARLAGRVIRRANVPDRRMERFRAKHVVIEASRPQPRQLDGDLVDEGTTLDVQIEPGALIVRVPR